MDKENNIISFTESLFEKLERGKITYDKFVRHEMLDLGFDPNKEKDVKDYLEFVENLQYLDEANIININDNDKE